jgi:enamine deaminase RidA (YjgF/YER057c/UK114 family)
MSRDIIVPKGDEALYDRFHFAQAARASCGLVVCSGQIGTDASGGVPEDPAEEFRNAWRAVERVLKAAELSLDDVLEYTTFHVGLQEHLATFMSVRDEFLSAPWPAWSAIGVSELAVAGGRCEIRVVAGSSPDT